MLKNGYALIENGLLRSTTPRMESSKCRNMPAEAEESTDVLEASTVMARWTPA